MRNVEIIIINSSKRNVDIFIFQYLVYGNFAVICLTNGNRELAIHLVKKAIKLNSEYPEGHNILGVAFKGKGDLISAIPAFQKAITLLIPKN